MTYEQLASGIFVRQNLIPRADLQADTVFPGGQYIHPGISQVLSYLTGQNAAGPRMLQVDSNGNLMTLSAGGVETLPLPTQTNLIALRTDTATFTSADMTLPAFTVALFTFHITAISGTGAGVTFTVQGKDTQGAYSSNNGGTASGSVTVPGATPLTASMGVSGANVILAPTFHIGAIIAGTLPSVSWYCDVVYK
jgi:hypothetical protein